MKYATLLFFLLVSACTSVGLYYKPGGSVQRADRELLACRVAAENEVPVREIIRVIPGPRLPPRRVCDAAGNCVLVPGRRFPPEIVTEDANEALRRRVVVQCMGDKGYQYVRVPYCSADITRTVTLKRTTVMPRLQENSCVIPLQSGGIQIVNPG